MFGKILNMPLALIVGNKNGFDYLYQIKDCHKPFPVQINNYSEFIEKFNMCICILKTCACAYKHVHIREAPLADVVQNLCS